MAETREICRILLKEVVKPGLDKNKNDDFDMMAGAVLHGMWHVKPYLEEKAFLGYMYYILLDEQTQNGGDKFKQIEPFTKLNLFQRAIFHAYSGLIYLLRYDVFRVISNYSDYFAVWIIQNFPILPAFSFGNANAYVTIFNNMKSNTVKYSN